MPSGAVVVSRSQYVIDSRFKPRSQEDVAVTVLEERGFCDVEHLVDVDVVFHVADVSRSS